MNYEEFKKPELMKKMAESIAHLHSLEPELKKEPILFKWLRTWCENLPTHYIDSEKQKKYTGNVYETIKSEIDYLEKKITPLNSPVVCCHNDLYLKNFVYNEKNETMKIIDFEYVSYNYQGFDLANNIDEWCGLVMDWSKYPSKESQCEFFRNYLRCLNKKEANDDEIEHLYFVVNHFHMASNLVWCLWGFIYAGLSTIDFDYLDYAYMRLNRYFELKKQFN